MIDYAVLLGNSVTCDHHGEWLADLSAMLPHHQTCFCLLHKDHVVQGRIIAVGTQCVVAAKRTPIPKTCIACCVIEGVERVVLPADSVAHAVEQAAKVCGQGGLARVEIHPIS